MAKAKQPWTRDDEVMRDMFLAYNSTEVPLETIAYWGDAECQAVEKYIGALMLKASDNIVRIPPKPACLDGIEGLR